MIYKAKTDKTPENVLREEILKERAEVLGRAGEKLSAAIHRMDAIEKGIQERWKQFTRERETCRKKNKTQDVLFLRRQMVKDINGEIRKYNSAREHAKLRYYYLIVTREAMGMRRHHWVEEMYRIPPKKKYLREG
ncbi:MAG: hypothetical protein FJ139_02970 [Deltaproteobacteria bacterium]|nr:hypothetical protein [Deltaproteobacteria bacterium]